MFICVPNLRLNNDQPNKLQRCLNCVLNFGIIVWQLVLQNKCFQPYCLRCSSMRGFVHELVAVFAVHFVLETNASFRRQISVKHQKKNLDFLPSLYYLFMVHLSNCYQENALRTSLFSHASAVVPAEFQDAVTGGVGVCQCVGRRRFACTPSFIDRKKATSQCHFF